MYNTEYVPSYASIYGYNGIMKIINNNSILYVFFIDIFPLYTDLLF